MASSVNGSVWRLTRPKYAPGIDGEGSKQKGGRWSSPGYAVVYCGSSLALCVVEAFVHLPPAMRTAATLPPMMAAEITLPDNEGSIIEAETIGPFDIDDETSCRALGDAWVAGLHSVGLSVPSAVVKQERNLILNVEHPAMASIAVRAQTAFNFDPRMVMEPLTTRSRRRAIGRSANGASAR